MVAFIAKQNLLQTIYQLQFVTKAHKSVVWT